MRLDDERISEHVEDRRYQSGGRIGYSGRSTGALIGLIRPLLGTKYGWVLIAAGIGLYMMGIDPMALLSGGAAPTHSSAPASKPSAKEEQQAVFIKKVLATTEDVWGQLFGPKHPYRPPTLVLFRGSTRSGCGYASAQTGPFYCPADQKVYLDLNFFDELARRFGASGDFAEAYVLAHEVGHHVQKLTGVLDKAQRLQSRAGRSGANKIQVAVELQADCYAGVWGHYVQKYMEPGDIDEALNAASQIGDDAIQKRTQGYVVPDSFTHGTSAQRRAAFKKGYDSGNPKVCAIRL
ncbi:MAG: zinc metallopeptidase [Epsilonproteobacteria bacterium]|nr:zinc metallopeptidase [Campylobacterota bacterium]